MFFDGGFFLWLIYSEDLDPGILLFRCYNVEYIV